MRRDGFFTPFDCDTETNVPMFYILFDIMIFSRLACVPHIEINAGKITRGRSTKYIDEIDFNSLLEHFQVKEYSLLFSSLSAHLLLKIVISFYFNSLLKHCKVKSSTFKQFALKFFKKKRVGYSLHINSLLEHFSKKGFSLN